MDEHDLWGPVAILADAASAGFEVMLPFPYVQEDDEMLALLQEAIDSLRRLESLIIQEMTNQRKVRR